MEKTKLLTYTVIALLLLNLGTLAYLFASAPKRQQAHGKGPHGKPMPREVIIEKLHFDPLQTRQYDQLIEWHRANVRVTEDKIRSSKNSLYRLLNEEQVDENAKTVLIDSIAQYQRQIESIHFRHFMDIRKLCKKEQLDDFAQLTNELSKLFSRPQKRRHD